MELLEKYIKEIEIDLKIDEMNVKEMSLKAPGKKHFWVSRLIRHKRNLIDLENQKEDLKKRVVNEIQHQSIVKLSYVAADKASDSTELIKSINKQIADEKILIEFLEKTEKIFSSLTYDIGNITKIMQLEQI
jgi:23S rRNA A1618 N6-methylase RlmF